MLINKREIKTHAVIWCLRRCICQK